MSQVWQMTISMDHAVAPCRAWFARRSLSERARARAGASGESARPSQSPNVDRTQTQCAQSAASRSKRQAKLHVPLSGLSPKHPCVGQSHEGSPDRSEGEPYFTHPAQIMGGLRICVAQRALTHAPRQIQGGEQTFVRPRRGCHDPSTATPRVARIAGRHRRCRWVSQRSERRLASRSGG